MQLVWPARNREFGYFDALGVVGALGFLVARFIPVARLPFWFCPLRQQTGWPCPSCGLTRAADRLSHGDVLGALEVNPLGALAGLMFALFALGTFVHLAFRVPIPDVRPSEREATWLRVALIAGFFANYGYMIVSANVLGRGG
jgi:hypothetical protein